MEILESYASNNEQALSLRKRTFREPGAGTVPSSQHEKTTLIPHEISPLRQVGMKVSAKCIRILGRSDIFGLSVSLWITDPPTVKGDLGRAAALYRDGMRYREAPDTRRAAEQDRTNGERSTERDRCHEDIEGHPCKGEGEG